MRYGYLAAGVLVWSSGLSAGVLDFPSFLIEQAQVSGTASIIRDVPRTYASHLDERLYNTQIDQPVLITGMQLRLAIGDNWRVNGYAGNSWPVKDLVMPDFRVYMGRPSALVGAWFPPGQTPFDSLFDGQVQTRSGEWVIPAGSFEATGGSTGIHAWGPTIEFDTPYLHDPQAPLVYMVRHSGMSNADVQGANFASRYAAPNTTDAAYAVGADAVVYTTFTLVHYVRWITAPVPEPAAVTAVLVGLSLLARRRD